MAPPDIDTLDHVNHNDATTTATPATTGVEVHPRLRLRHRPIAKPRSLLLPALLAAAVVLCGCTDTDGPAADATTTPAVTSTTAASTVPPVNPDNLADGIADITEGDTVGLTTATLPEPPRNFTRAEVVAFANRAIDIARRGTAPALNGLDPAEAFDYVFKNQYQASRQDARRSTEAAAGGYDWEWAWASLFDQPPAEPAVILAANWQVESVPSKRADGATAPRLQVSLSTAFEYLVPREGQDTADTETAGQTTMEPIVVLRTIIVAGFEPLGGPDWWPGIGVQANPLFGGKCAPVNGSILTPARSAETLSSDLETLRNYIAEPDRVDTAATSEGAGLADYVEKYCED